MLITVLLILVDATSIIVSLVMNGLEKYLIFVMVLWILMTLIYVSLDKTIICDHMWYYSASCILVCVCCETFVSFSTTMRNSLHTSSTPVISRTTGTSTDATSKNPELRGLVTLCIVCRNYWNTGLMLRSHCIKPRSFGKVFIAVAGLSMIIMTELYSGYIQLREVFSVNLF